MRYSPLNPFQGRRGFFSDVVVVVAERLQQHEKRRDIGTDGGRTQRDQHVTEA